jgi:hypothetical protein
LVVFSIADVDELERYIAYSEITLYQAQECLEMIIFEKQKAFMATMKARNQMEDQNNHHHEEEHALQKMFIEVEQEDCENKKGMLKKIDTQKGVVAYL